MPDKNIYFTDTKAKAIYATDGPQPQILFEAPNFKALVVGLEAGQQIPLHPGKVAMYHFLEGSGLMTVGDETYAAQPGVTIITPQGKPRGVNAKTRLVFLASTGE